MSEEWLEFLKENNPELYAQAVASVEHAVRWRDLYINRLESERDQLRAQLDESEAWLFDTQQDRDEILAELEKAESHIIQLSGESALSTNKPAG